ncbi:glycoside hydrolase family 16 protein [Kiritimatiellaeota bacterium B1221]|nr:glycoside hydrolase family 16 protein [Kiritimatiellaeota bacterium B1221]
MKKELIKKMGIPLMVMSAFHLQAVEDRLSLLAVPGHKEQISVNSNSEQITTEWDGNALSVNVSPGKAGPAIYISLSEGEWDLSRFGHVEAMITNPMDEPLRISLRVDNAGDWRDEPWNTEVIRVLPGKTMPLKVIFGHQYGYKAGYKLDPAKISKFVVFIDQTKVPVSFRIESLVASGEAGEKPEVDPKYMRHVPKAGFILGGADVKFDLAKQIKHQSDGVEVEDVEWKGQSALQVKLSGQTTSKSLVLKPASGRWDLSQSNEMQLTVTNVGESPVTPSLSVANGGQNESTDIAKSEVPLAPGESRTIVASYVPEKSWIGPDGDLTKHAERKGTLGTSFKSEKAEKVILGFEHAGDAQLRIDSLQAVAQSRPVPQWLGKRPPVEGNWELTLEDNFDGDSINEEVWHVHGPNWWGNKKLTHWSRDNVIVKDGTATIRMEKKKGFHNDDPAGPTSEYQGGVLRTYGKWTQKYGYFESRMKLPTAAAMWPAFWLMPDRGVEAGEQWRRADIGNGGMEFDIFEHLTRWGPYRYTTAMHWDGYGKEHKATGATVYFYPDEEGYVTSGLLWLPGLMVYYCNGREVARWENDRVSTIQSSILYTMPLGGWDNEKVPNDDELPADYIIDYIRVWQLKEHMRTE